MDSDNTSEQPSETEYRTSIENVRMEIEADGFETEAITDAQIEVVGLTPAALTVDEDLAETGMSNDRLALIERYLAGHHILASGIDELRQADTATNSDGSAVTYAGDRAHTDYRATSLGQKALMTDETGTLHDASKQSASIAASDVREHGHGHRHG